MSSSLRALLRTLAVAALLVGVAWAGVPEDLTFAADTSKPQAERQAALQRLSQAENLQTLVTAAQNPKLSPQEHWVAVRAMGFMPADEARQALFKLLESPDPNLRMAALGALGDRGDRSTSGRVAARLEDKALLVRWAAADALKRLGDPSTLPDLARALQDPTNYQRGTSLWLRASFVEAMVPMGHAAVPYLAQALNDSDPAVVQAAIKGLEKVAGFSYAEGRSTEEQVTAWKRWAGAK